MESLPPKAIQQAIDKVARQARLGRVPIERIIYTQWDTTGGILPVVIVPLDLGGMERPSARLLSESVRHEIGTHLGGALVLASNHSGARYVIFPHRPRLPERLPCPPSPAQDTFPLGVTIDERLHLHADSLQNILIGGAQGSGKSTFLHLLARTALGHGWQLWLADPQENTFSAAEWGLYTAVQPAASPAAFLALLERLHTVYRQRSALFAAGERPCRNLTEYNRRAEIPLPRIALLVDEANTFLAERSIREAMADVSRQGRKYGVLLALAGHDWRGETIPKGLSANFKTRITFRVDDDTSGQVVLLSRKLGQAALRLRHPGRGIGRIPGVGIRLFQACLPPEMPLPERREPAPPLNDADFERVRAAAPQGQVTIALIAKTLGLSEWQARRRQERWSALGWIARNGSNAYEIMP